MPGERGALAPWCKVPVWGRHQGANAPRSPSRTVCMPRPRWLLTALLLLAVGPGGWAGPDGAKTAKLSAQEVAERVDKAGKDPILLLEIAALAAEPQARDLRRQAKGLLAAQLPAGAEEAQRLARRLAQALAASRSLADVEEVLGEPRLV